MIMNSKQKLGYVLFKLSCSVLNIEHDCPCVQRRKFVSFSINRGESSKTIEKDNDIDYSDDVYVAMDAECNYLLFVHFVTNYHCRYVKCWLVWWN